MCIRDRSLTFKSLKRSIKLIGKNIYEKGILTIKTNTKKEIITFLSIFIFLYNIFCKSSYIEKYISGINKNIKLAFLKIIKLKIKYIPILGINIYKNIKYVTSIF